MGGCVNKEQKTPTTKKIEDDIKKQYKTFNSTQCLLLLGTGNAGKSTFARQMSALYAKKNVDNEFLLSFKNDLKCNTIDSAKILVEKLRELKIQSVSREHQELLLDSITLNPENAKIIETMFQDKAVVKLLEELGDEMEFPAGVAGVNYFFSHVTTFADPSYIPTMEDVARIRRKTTGIQEFDLAYEGHNLKLIDVGGQLSERRKWLSLFDRVSLIIFLVALNEYDLTLEEDKTKNRLVDALSLWLNLTQAQTLRMFYAFMKIEQVPFVLFLNKSDLFKKKIEKVPVSSMFNDWDDYMQNRPKKISDNFENSWNFFAYQFQNHYRGSKPLTVHLTSAVDPDCCKKVWGTVITEFLRSALKDFNIGV